MRAHIQVRERTNGPLSEVPKFLRGKNQNGFCSKMKCLYLVLNTNYITPWSRVLLENLTVNQLVKTFPVFYGTRRFITMLTRAATGSYLESEGSSPRRDNVWMNGGIVPRVLNLGRFTPGGQPVPIWYEVGWAPEPFWTRWQREKFSTTAENRTSVVQSLAVTTLTYPGSYYISCSIQNTTNLSHA
jgi:hypothetical protein